MREHIGEEFDATITGVSDHGFYASLESPFVDVLCRIASLPRDRYQLDPHGVRLEGLLAGHRFALGDAVRVRIEDVSIAQRKISAVPVEAAASEGERGAGAGSRDRRRAKQERAEDRRVRDRRERRDGRRKQRVETRKKRGGRR
jgi:ribonuclease R